MRRDEGARLLALLEAQAEQHASERASWEAERTRLVNTILSKSSGEFKVRQASSGLLPIADLPREAREAQPKPMGF